MFRKKLVGVLGIGIRPIFLKGLIIYWKDLVNDEMLKRKLNTKRLYKLSKILVILLTVIFLLTSLSYTQKQYKELEFDCTEASDEQRCNDIKWDFYVKYATKSETYLIVGLTIPVFFFSDTWLFNYLSPRRQKEA